MKELSYQERSFQYLLFGLFLGTALYVFSIGSIMEPDTGSYLHLTIITTPAYPLFLYGFKKIFGTDGLGIYVVVLQLLYGLYAIWYFSKESKHFFKLSTLFSTVLGVILIVPYWDPNILVANRIVSEGLAYPTFLIWLALFLQCIHKINRKKALKLFIVLGFLISLRPQFNFIIPGIGLVLLIGLGTTFSKKKVFMGMISILVLLILLNVFEKGYHFALRGEFTKTANTGVQLMTLPMFVADAEDYIIFEDKRQQEYFKHVYNKADSLRLLQSYATPTFDQTIYHHLHNNYASLSYQVLSQQGRKFINPTEVESQQTLISNNNLLISMWLPLVLDNFSSFFDVFFLNVINAFDGYVWLVVHILLLAFVLYDWKYRQRVKSMYLCFLLILVGSNTLLVCLVEHSIDRYFIYTRWMLPFIFLIILHQNYTLLIKNKHS